MAKPTDEANFVVPPPAPALRADATLRIVAERLGVDPMPADAPHAGIEYRCSGPDADRYDIGLLALRLLDRLDQATALKETT